MQKNSIFKTMLLAFAFLFAFSFAAHAQKTDCSKTTDEQIVQSIYEKIEAKYADQTNHINVRIKDGTVTLEGWTTNKKARKEIEKFARKTACVKKVVNNLTLGVSGGCAAGTKPCGDICIPTNEVCNIRTKGN